jgi:EpsG family
MENATYTTQNRLNSLVVLKNNALISLFLLLLAFILGYVAGNQLLGTSRDYPYYLSYFDYSSSKTLDQILEYRFEPLFAVCTYFFAQLGLSDTAIYTAFATCCLFVKFNTVSKQSKDYPLLMILVILFYLCRYFTLFEMTVLRATCATSIMFYVFYSKVSGQTKLLDVLLMFCAVGFHYSSVALIPFYFFVPSNRKQLLLMSMCVFVIVFSIKGILVNVLPDYLQVFSNYGNKDFESATIFPVPLILDTVFVTYAICEWGSSSRAMQVAIYGSLVAIILHFALLDSTLLAGRFRELFSIFLPLYVIHAMISQSIRVKIVTVLYVFVSSIMFVYVFYVHDPLLTFAFHNINIFLG